MKPRRRIRWVDHVQAARRRLSHKRTGRSGLVVVCTGPAEDIVLLSIVLPRLRALVREREPVLLVLDEAAMAPAFLCEGTAELFPVDMGRFGAVTDYRANMLSAVYEFNARGVVSMDYDRDPALDEALIEAMNVRGMGLVPRPGGPASRAGLFEGQFNSGPAGTHRLVRWSRFVDWLLDEETPLPKVRLPEESLAGAGSPEPPTLVIQPFSRIAGKQPRADFYRPMIDMLPADWQVVVLGSEALLERSPDVRGLIDPPRVVLHETDLEGAVPLLRSARLVVSAESAPLHLSCAVGAPTLGLVSAAQVGETVPYDEAIRPDNAHFMVTGIDCAGCLDVCNKVPEDGKVPCVARLDAHAAAAEAARILGL